MVESHSTTTRARKHSNFGPCIPRASSAPLLLALIKRQPPLSSASDALQAAQHRIACSTFHRCLPLSLHLSVLHLGHASCRRNRASGGGQAAVRPGQAPQPVSAAAAVVSWCDRHEAESQATGRAVHGRDRTTARIHSDLQSSGQNVRQSRTPSRCTATHCLALHAVPCIAYSNTAPLCASVGSGSCKPHCRPSSLRCPGSSSRARTTSTRCRGRRNTWSRTWTPQRRASRR